MRVCFRPWLRLLPGVGKVGSRDDRGAQAPPSGLEQAYALVDSFPCKRNQMGDGND